MDEADPQEQDNQKFRSPYTPLGNRNQGKLTAPMMPDDETFEAVSGPRP